MNNQVSYDIYLRAGASEQEPLEIDFMNNANKEELSAQRQAIIFLEGKNEKDFRKFSNRLTLSRIHSLGFNISNFEFDELHISEGIISGELHLHNVKCSHLKISTCEAKNIHLSNCCISRIEIEEIYTLKISHPVCPGVYEINPSPIEPEIEQQIELLGFSESTKVKIHTGWPPNPNQTLVGLTITEPSNLNLEVASSIKISKLLLRKSFHETNLVFNDNISSSVEFRDFSTNKRVIFRGIKLDSNGSLNFFNSFLENVEFHSCKFHSANLIFENSDFGNCTSLNTEWPDYPLTSENDQKAIYYRHLHNSAEKGGDTSSKFRYRNKELEALQKSKFSWPDHPILWMGKISSNHGTRWYQPLGIIFFSNLAALFLTYHTTIESNSGFSLGLAIRDLFVFINPIYRTDTLSFFNYDTITETERSNIFSIHNCMKIVNSYLIFQFVRCVRKFYK